MRVCVVVPRSANLTSAGARIRYDRLAGPLAQLGITLEQKVLTDFRRGTTLDHDAYILSKCYDASSLVLVQTIAAAAGNKLIGLDLFDDYFSQAEDARFVHQRGWLRELAGRIDFVWCSTARMREVVAQHAPAIPVHVINDPFDDFDAEAIGRRVARNLEQARKTRELQIGWFGIGDNPYFNVGLSDLAAFAPMLGVFARHGYAPRLRILTNLRALHRRSLEMLRRMPLPFTIKEWSEKGEKDLVGESLFCFLPVNAQAFSIAKSLNRAVTVLTGGSQVLSAGYPLYGAFGDFVYRDPQVLLGDIEAGRLAMRAETLPQLRTVLDACADPTREAQKTAEFLGSLRAGTGKTKAATLGGKRPILGLLNGRVSIGEVHKFTQAMGQLSIATPLSTGALNYDMALVANGDGATLDLELSESAAGLLEAEVRERLERKEVPAGKRVYRLPSAVTDDALLARLSVLRGGAPTLAAATFYAPLTEDLRAALGRLMPKLDFVLSETGPLFALRPAGAPPVTSRSE